MVEEPSHVKQLSLNHACKIGLHTQFACCIGIQYEVLLLLSKSLMFICVFYTSQTGKNRNKEIEGFKELYEQFVRMLGQPRPNSFSGAADRMLKFVIGSSDFPLYVFIPSM